MVGSDGRTVGTCPPVVEYSREFQARAAEELALLPDGSAIIDLLADYAVMRDQARFLMLDRDAGRRKSGI